MEIIVLWRFDEVAVVTALLQLHHDVEETRRASFRAFAECLVVSCQDPPMKNNVFNHVLISDYSVSLSRIQNLPKAIGTSINV